LTFAVSIFGSFELFSITLRPASSHFVSLPMPSQTNLRNALADVEKARDMVFNQSIYNSLRLDLANVDGGILSWISESFPLIVEKEIGSFPFGWQWQR